MGTGRQTPEGATPAELGKTADNGRKPDEETPKFSDAPVELGQRNPLDHVRLIEGELLPWSRWNCRC